MALLRALLVACAVAVVAHSQPDCTTKPVCISAHYGSLRAFAVELQPILIERGRKDVEINVPPNICNGHKQVGLRVRVCDLSAAPQVHFEDLQRGVVRRVQDSLDYVPEVFLTVLCSYDPSPDNYKASDNKLLVKSLVNNNDNGGNIISPVHTDSKGSSPSQRLIQNDDDDIMRVIPLNKVNFETSKTKKIPGVQLSKIDDYETSIVIPLSDSTVPQTKSQSLIHSIIKDNFGAKLVKLSQSGSVTSQQRPSYNQKDNNDELNVLAMEPSDFTATGKKLWLQQRLLTDYDEDDFDSLPLKHSKPMKSQTSTFSQNQQLINGNYHNSQLRSQQYLGNHRIPVFLQSKARQVSGQTNRYIPRVQYMQQSLTSPYKMSPAVRSFQQSSSWAPGMPLTMQPLKLQSNWSRRQPSLIRPPSQQSLSLPHSIPSVKKALQRSSGWLYDLPIFIKPSPRGAVVEGSSYVSPSWPHDIPSERSLPQSSNWLHDIPQEEGSIQKSLDWLDDIPLEEGSLQQPLTRQNRLLKKLSSLKRQHVRCQFTDKILPENTIVSQDLHQINDLAAKARSARIYGEPQQIIDTDDLPPAVSSLQLSSWRKRPQARHQPTSQMRYFHSIRIKPKARQNKMNNDINLHWTKTFRRGNSVHRKIVDYGADSNSK